MLHAPQFCHFFLHLVQKSVKCFAATSSTKISSCLLLLRKLPICKLTARKFANTLAHCNWQEYQNASIQHTPWNFDNILVHREKFVNNVLAHLWEVFLYASRMVGSLPTCQQTTWRFANMLANYLEVCQHASGILKSLPTCQETARKFANMQSRYLEACQYVIPLPASTTL